MKRVVLLGVLLLVPALSAAQVPPPAAPAPPPPLAAPMPPLAQVPPVPRVIAVPTVIDRWDFENSTRLAFEQAQETARSVDVQAAREAAIAAVVSSDAAREMAERAREDALGAQVWTMRPFAAPEMRMRDAFPFQDGKFMTMPGQDAESSSYSSAMSALQQAQYDQAIARFDRTISQKGTHADGAWYWKAFAQYKLGKGDEALASIASLRKDFPQSKYLNDAKALEADVRKPRPETIDNDDEIKLLAIQGIQNSDPVKAAQLAGTLLAGTNSLQVKRRALYILALSDQPSAHELLLSYAKGNGNPDLQREAINYLATRRTKQPTTSSELRQIYESTQDLTVRRAIIDAYRSTGDKASLLTVASTNGPVEMRSRAINNLSDLAVPADLWALYQKEEDKDLRIAMVRSFSSMGAVDQLLQIAKSDKDPTVRQQAIRSLGNQKVEKTGTTLVDMYGSETDKASKLAIISALGNQNNDTGLVALARKETKDLELKRELLRRIAEMSGHSKVAADYLLEVLK